MMYEPGDAAHSFIPTPAQEHDVILAARRAAENGARQWIHHHPHGHLCDHRCGPLSEVAP